MEAVGRDLRLPSRAPLLALLAANAVSMTGNALTRVAVPWFVLGEIPDQHAALRDLGRVLKPGGRLVVREVFPDFHMVPFGTLKERAEAAGLTFEHRIGGSLGYFASFRAPSGGGTQSLLLKRLTRS